MIKKTMAGCQNHVNSKMLGIISKLAKNSLRIIFVFLRSERWICKAFSKCLTSKAIETMKNSPDSSGMVACALRHTVVCL